MFDEKRKQVRYDSLNLMYISLDKDGAVFEDGMGRTLNISESGILLETNFIIDPDSLLRFQIALEDDLVNVSGRVAHSREVGDGKFCTGVTFDELDEADRAILQQFIKVFSVHNR